MSVNSSSNAEKLSADIVESSNGVQVKKNNNTMLLIGFITGIISLLLSFYGIVGIFACTFSGVGLGKFNSETENNKWMGIVGIISGICSILYSLYELTQL
jgi:hypothetical protein